MVLALTAALLIIYDIVIVLTLGGSATISWQLYTFSQKYPVLAVAIGIVIGHLFWVQNCLCVK